MEREKEAKVWREKRRLKCGERERKRGGVKCGERESLFGSYGISTFVGNLMPNPFLCK